MVAALEPITEPQLAEVLPIDDRPNGRSIYEDSSNFYSRHVDLLPHGHGVVAEVPVNSYAGQRLETHTVILGSGENGQRFTWQYTVAHPFQERGHDTRHQLAPIHRSGRTVYQLHSQEGAEPTAWAADYDSKGRLIAVKDLEGQEIPQLWADVSSLLDSGYTKKAIEELRAQKQRQYKKLKAFTLKREIEYERKDFGGDGTNEKSERKTVRLEGDAYLKEKDRRQKIIAGFGFATLRPMARPSL